MRDLIKAFSVFALITFTSIGLRAQQSISPPFSSAVKTNESAVAAISTYKKMSIEELMNQEVTIVSKTPEKLSASPSAVQVITGEEIHRSGAMTLPQALRLAPNLEVAQVNSHDWAISARGFNNTTANKLLVMIDGRTIYTPLYAGVFWDAQSVLLEDIDRIEVVSGPGGTLWGANAVNGVINIVTKSARDTQGGFVSGGAGSFLQDYGAIRYGGVAASNLFYRVYAERYDHENTTLANGNDAKDDWDLTQAGFRMDYYPSENNTLTLQGDIYVGNQQRILPDDTKLDGENLLGRWTHVFSDTSDLSVQMYFDRTWRQIPNSFAEELETYDLDIQHRFALGERQSILWGGGYRLMSDHVKNSPMLAFLPKDLDMELFSAFIQDEITFIPERLKLTVGTKLEHNHYSGFEFQPSARLAWTPTDRQTIWGAVSRAVRSPSRIDTDYYTPAPPVAPGTPNLAGGPNFDSEKLLAFEAGYRIRPFERLSLSLSGYYNIYRSLRSLDRLTTSDYVLANHFEGDVWGIELSGNYQVTDWWQLKAGYTYLNKNLKPTDSIALPSVREGNDPENQFLIHSMMNLPGNFEFDSTIRYVDQLNSPHVASYVTVDLRLAWTYKEKLEISVIGQNLGDGQHTEFGTQQIPRSIFGKITWRF